MVFVAIIVVSVLLFTSRTFGEVPVLVMTFVIAMVLNLGTNFLFGRISFIANSVTSILQLALSLDYAIILCNHFKEEHQLLPIREAAIAALSKAIPEIFASSLTTIGGLVALIFMNFRIGADMGRCLIKAILFAILTVFTVMPGLLVLFGNVIDKTVHRDLVPKIPFVGRFAYATRHVIPIVFVLLVAAAYLISSKLPYAYGYSTLPTVRLNETKYAQKLIEETFDTQNNLALIVPSGDYKTEAALLAELEAYPEIESAMGLANIEAMDGYMLADALSPREFAELADLDYETAQLVYAAYAAEHEEYGRLAGQIASYRVPLIDMFLFVCDELDAGVVSLDTDTTARLQDAQVQMLIAKRQLQGEQYSRMLLDLDLPVSADETFDFLDVIEQIAEKYYPDASVYMAGNSTNGYDFKKSFARDNTVVGVLSILIVLGVLLFTFQSAVMPLLLILVIQGAIWINFSIPALKNDVVFFMTYLIISSLQMGSNIDYAIVIASRYQEIKYKMSHRDAIIETMNFAFPTIITSGTIMILSGILVGYMTSDAIISGIGQSLARGTTVSVLLVMFVLPQILLLGGGIIDKTSFSVPNTLTQHTAGSGRVFIDGKVRGEVHGTVNGFFRGAIYGDTDLTVLSGANASASEEQEENRHEA
ncbi:MAG: MMPL family transporter [Clostridia bacterium]|nr:MMPL family transporter [Clostridia bacterium]